MPCTFLKAFFSFIHASGTFRKRHNVSNIEMKERDKKMSRHKLYHYKSCVISTRASSNGTIV